MGNFLLGLFFTNIKNIFNLGFLDHSFRTKTPMNPLRLLVPLTCGEKATGEPVDRIEEADK